MKEETDQIPEIRVEVAPSAPRRIFAVAVLMVLGAVFVYLALSDPPDNFLLQAILIVAGGLISFGAVSLYYATSNALILTRTGLSERSGRIIASFDDIAAVDRGVFAFKPSNGFVIQTHKPLGFAWAPGLWWRVGRRVGVGGVTPALQTKAMAETMMVLLERKK